MIPKDIWFNVHRHGEYSSFDGMGKARHAVKKAKELGQTALGLTDHGNISGLIEHYLECKENGIKPIVGVEAYFQPKFNKDKPGYHLTIIAMNKNGYSNMCNILSEAAYNNFYRTAKVDLNLLEKYNKDIIVCSACVAGFIPQMYLKDRQDLAEKMLKRMKNIFDDRFYLELMPQEVVDEKYPSMQSLVNNCLMKLGERTNTKCIITTDSHFINKSDLDTHNMMFKIGKVKQHADYSKRYMPSSEEVYNWFKDLHGINPIKYMKNTMELADRCDVNLDFKEMIPELEWGMSSKKKLKQITIQGLKEKNKFTEKYINQVKFELDVIFELGFEDYFLICWDIINYCNKNDIAVGPGRGSSAGSTLAYAIGITNVDPLILGTTFERFLRKDKKKMPDIDMDICQYKRPQVVDYIINKRYKGRAAQIATFGFYKAKNLGNDLARIYEMDKMEIDTFKEKLEKVYGDRSRTEDVELEELMKDKYLRMINKKYPKILKHFSILCGQIRFIGKHAAGIAITKDKIENYCQIMKIKGIYQSCYDLKNLDKIKVLKIDVLGLTAATICHETEKMVNKRFDYEMLKDEKVYERFRNGDTIGIFQFEKRGAIQTLVQIEPNCIEDIIAASALNRPAPLQLGVLEDFVEGKNGKGSFSGYHKYLKGTYGCVIYQEDVMTLCRKLAHMEWQDIDKQLKTLRCGSSDTMDTKQEELERLKSLFIEGSIKHTNIKRKDAAELYEKMVLYLFNKSHGAAYGLISFYEMWLKIYHPLEFWFNTLRFESVDDKRNAYKSQAIKEGIVIMLPHVNGKAEDTIEEYEGELVIREGLKSIKGIGEKTAKVIEEYGKYSCEEDFMDEVPKRQCNKRSIEVLKTAGALEFDKDIFLKRTIAYNSFLYAKKVRIL